MRLFRFRPNRLNADRDFSHRLLTTPGLRMERLREWFSVGVIRGIMLYGGHIQSVDDIRDLKDLGLDFGELVLKNSAARSYWAESGFVGEVGSDWFMIAHGPREGPPNDVRRLWDRYYADLRETLDLSNKLGITFLTIHLWLDPRFVKREVVVEKIAFLKEIVFYGKKRNMIISLENLSENSDDLKEVFSEVPDLSLTLDVGHGQLLAEQNTSLAIIEELAGCIGHVHMHDNRGGTGVADDLHLPIGTGSIDFLGILKPLVKSYNGTITLELEKKDLPSSRLKLATLVESVRSLPG